VRRERFPRIEVGNRLPGSISLRLFHRLRELVGEKVVRISPVPDCITGLISRFLELYPGAKDEMLDDGGELSHTYVVAVNENLVKRSGWGDVTLADGDEIAFLTMISGG
jgi:thiamine biosynthesis protein ThiS